MCKWLMRLLRLDSRFVDPNPLSGVEEKWKPTPTEIDIDHLISIFKKIIDIKEKVKID